MYKAKTYFSHWIGEMEFPVPVEIHSCFVNHNQINPNSYNVLNLSNEPEPTRMKNNDVIILHNKFNLILTWDTELLLNLPNATFFPMGMCWIRKEDYELIDVGKKNFSVSFICGSKNITSNHLLRQKIYMMKNDINNEYGLDVKFWNSAHNPMPITYNPLGENPEDKIEVFRDTQFHIAIENSNYENYFSEKLIDCFMTKTIPIYCGCTNLSTFFDTRGIITFRNGDPKDVIQICNHLTPSYYKSHLEYIYNNFENAKKYAKDFTERLKEIIDLNLLQFTKGDL